MANALMSILSFFSVHQVPPPVAPLTNNLFAAEFSSLVVNDKSAENVVYSPVSIHSSLALMLMGAADHTERDIKNALKLGKEPKANLAIKYGFFLNDTFQNQNDGQQLLIANGLFVSNTVKVVKRFSDLASYYFKSQIENIDLNQNQMAAERINDWVGQQTKDKIRDLIKPESLSSNTKAVLVNAVYFKGTWEYTFNADDTKKRDFHISPSQKVSVDTMFLKYYFRYAELPKLNAKALELSYKNSNISMLILLPNKIDGLEKLENNLKGMDLNKITAQMNRQMVNVYLPKFRIESVIDLKEPLKKMGLSSLFENANLSDMFDNAPAQAISDVKQKTVITCNEEGAEAVSATATFIVFKSLFTPPEIYFRADHPFVFIIRSEAMVYFYGHVAKF